MGFPGRELRNSRRISLRMRLQWRFMSSASKAHISVLLSLSGPTETAIITGARGTSTMGTKGDASTFMSVRGWAGYLALFGYSTP